MFTMVLIVSCQYFLGSFRSSDVRTQALDIASAQSHTHSRQLESVVQVVWLWVDIGEVVL